MKLGLGSPLWLRAYVRGRRLEQDVLCGRTTEHEIPELSEAAAPVVFSTRIKFDEHGRISRAVEIRGHGGRLWRKIGPLDDDLRVRLLRSFDPYSHEDIGYESELSNLLHRPFHAVAGTIERQYAWLMRTHPKTRSNRVVGTWPGRHSDKGPARTRNGRSTLDEVMPFITSFREDDMARADAMLAGQAAKLAMIGDTLWYSCRPVCIVVQPSCHVYDHQRYGDKALLRFATLPEWHDIDLSTRYFSLHEEEEAIAFAESLRQDDGISTTSSTPNGGSKFLREAQDGILDTRVPFEGDPDAVLPFSSLADLVWRTGMAMTSQITRHLWLNPSRLGTFGPEEARTFGEAHGLAIRSDHVIGVKGDFGPILVGLYEMWKSLRMNVDMPLQSRENQAALIEEAISRLDDLPISVFDVG